MLNLLFTIQLIFLIWLACSVTYVLLYAVTGYFYKTKSSAPCYIPTNRVYIDYNGDVNLCCHDWKNKHVFGNIKDNHINNIWNTRMKSIKIQLANGNRECLDACKGCDVEFDPLSLVYKHEYEITQFQRLKHLGIDLE